MYLAGQLAQQGGQPKDHCPYDPELAGSAYQAWCSGWEDACQQETLP